jgi:hypothetical protein
MEFGSPKNQDLTDRFVAMEEFMDLFNEYKSYIILAAGIILGLIVLRIILNRPSKRDKEHQARIDVLKEKHKDRYKDVRRLR